MECSQQYNSDKKTYMIINIQSLLGQHHGQDAILLVAWAKTLWDIFEYAPPSHSIPSLLGNHLSSNRQSEIKTKVSIPFGVSLKT